MSLHLQIIYKLMKDMSHEMSKMTEQMSGSDLPPELREQMSQRMTLMSTMMLHLSGLAPRPAMSDQESQKEVVEMRHQMDDMMRVSQKMQ